MKDALFSSESIDQSGLSGPLSEMLGWLEVTSGVLVLIGAPILLLELFRLWRSGQLNRSRITGILTSFFCALPAIIVKVLFSGMWLVIGWRVFSLSPWSVPVSVGSVLLAVLLIDFISYWHHRISHEVNVLWAAYHSVHHSADHFDQSISFRLSFVGFFIAPVFYLPLMALGFHPLLVFACLGLARAWQQWIHTEQVGKLPWLDGWLNTPSNHRVHHGRNPEYLDKNYGGVLILWDRLFGTYAPEVAPVDYGLVFPLKSRHPWTVHFHLISKLWKRLRRADSFSAVFSLLFGTPAAQKAGPISGK